MDTSEAIREVKANYSVALADAEVTLKRAETICLSSLNEAEDSHTAGIWRLLGHCCTCAPSHILAVN